MLLEQAQTVAATEVNTARALVERASKYLGERDPRVTQTKMQVEVEAARTGTNPMAEVTIGLFDKAISSVGAALRNLTPQFIASLIASTSDMKPDQVVTTLKAVLRIWPAHVQAREELIACLLNQHDLSAAAEVLKQGEDLNLESPRLLWLKGRLFEARGELSEAIRLYRRAVRRAPGDDVPSNALVSTLIKAGRKDDALNELERRLDARSSDATALHQKGNLLLEIGRLNDAQECLEAAEKSLSAEPGQSIPDLLQVRISLGQASKDLDRFEDASTAFDRAIDVEHDMPYEARARKASLLIEIAEYQTAAELLAATITLFPAANDGSANERLGWLHYAQGWALRCTGHASLPEIERLFRAALKLSPDDPYAKENLASLLLHSEDLRLREEAKELLVNLTDSAEQVPLTLLGWCHFLRCRYEAAEHWLRAAMSSAPRDLGATVNDDDITNHFVLALVLLAARPEEGQKEYAIVINHAQRRPVLRRRGLLHIATQQLIEAARDRVIDHQIGHSTWVRLRAELEAAEYLPERLTMLCYP